jgi:DNA polymerase-3 subunit alpha
MAFAQLEDLSGSVEVIFFPEAFSRSQAALSSDQPVVVRGKVERKEDGAKMLADSAEAADTVRERTTSRVVVSLPSHAITAERIHKFKELLGRNKGRCELRIWLQEAGVFRAPLRMPDWLVSANRSLKNDICALFMDEADVKFE